VILLVKVESAKGGSSIYNLKESVSVNGDRSFVQTAMRAGSINNYNDFLYYFK
jgi:hypothetical protein